MEDTPRKLNIEVTTKCNLNCAMCVRTVWQEDTGDMSLETFNALSSAFPKIESINLIGIGEPLIHPDIIEMIKIGKNLLPPEGKLSLTTNAMLIDQNIAQKLVELKVDDIIVSIDSAN
ncbi:MAG: radical SAM protein, partial [Pseudomonadota bacterium]|nr:radical SAM protein [Pseudomonadota bacterium]